MSRERIWASGIGYDIHRLEKGRHLILGGVEIPFHLGLAGHSDADVLVHALMDALLGAVGLPDIGTHFSNDDPAYKDSPSLDLLQKVSELVGNAGWHIGNVDTVLMAEQPKIAPFRKLMIANLAKILEIKPEVISIKATTNEGMGALGRNEGIAAMAIAQLWRYTSS